MLGPPEERLMLSGLHTVEDIFCCCCGQILGWKYVSSLLSVYLDREHGMSLKSANMALHL